MFEFRCPACRREPGRVRDRLDRLEFDAQREDWTPDASQQAAHDLAYYEAQNHIRAHLTSTQHYSLPQEFQLVMGRHIEDEWLEESFVAQARGEGPLPLP